MEQDKKYMSLALEESKKALPDCLPNPPVGCVLVKNGEVVSKGYTQAPGLHHAEASALASYAGSLEGVTAYVTLEPCSFHGRTPSCAEALSQRNISHVHVAVIDPDARNNGKGIAKLKEAGVKVTENTMSEAVAEFLSPYLGDLSPQIRTMTTMRFPINLSVRRSHNEKALYRRTNHIRHQTA